MSKTLETKLEARSNFFYSSHIKTEPKVFNDNADILLTIRRAGNVKNEKAKEMKTKNLLGTVSTCMFSVILPGAKPLIETKTYGEISAEILLHVTRN